MEWLRTCPVYGTVAPGVGMEPPIYVEMLTVDEQLLLWTIEMGVVDKTCESVVCPQLSRSKDDGDDDALKSKL